MILTDIHSFLDESNNTDLIRWSDDGNSFIVLDEDEFANTLIPELFKSNKYASFVRQLNMYGFHKKVGLSDNSMRASEKKNKSPSEFYNPYFKRGRPDLLWLIHKPKSGLIQPKRKKDEKGKLAGDSSDEDKRLAAAPGGSGNSDKGQLKPSEISGDSTHQELATLPSSELVSLRQELQALQRQQRFISKVITQVREQNHQLYQQATAFQALHDRHENSISAILTFLATFYNRNVEGLGTQNLANMFANAIPQTTQQQGTVEDMGEYREGDANTHKLTRVSRRPHLLLPPPTEKSPRISTESPDLGPSQQSHQPNDEQNHQPGKPSGDFHGRPDPSANDIMALIKDANASAAVSPTKHTQGTPQSSFDFPEALSHYQSANGNNPLTAQERDRMLALMAKEQQDSANRQTQTSNNALTTPNPPPMPSLDNFAASQQQLDMLQRLQQEQDAKVQSLADRLQPLSPTGSIPGLNTLPGDGNNLGPPSDLDLNSFISNDDYFTGSNNNIDPGNNLFDPSDFGMDFGGPDNTEFGTTGEFDFGAGDNPSGLDENGWSEGPLVGGQTPDGRGRIVESVSSEATSPAATGTGDEGANDDQGGPQSNNERLKRRRLR